MPRFFFSLIADGQRSEDIVGSDIPDVETAFAEARSVVAEMVMERLKRGEASLSQEVELRDSEGHVLGRKRITVAVDENASP